MTNLSGGERHKHIMKKVGCDPPVKSSKATTLKRRPLGHAMRTLKRKRDISKIGVMSRHERYR